MKVKNIFKVTVGGFSCVVYVNKKIKRLYRKIVFFITLCYTKLKYIEKYYEK